MPLLYGGWMPMRRANSYEDMIRVFTPFPLDGENYDEFYWFLIQLEMLLMIIISHLMRVMLLIFNLCL